MKITLLWALLTVFAIGYTIGQSTAPMPKLVHNSGRHALLVDGQPFLILGGQAHNSSAWPRMMPQVWAAAEKMNLNTLEVPVYWEQIEPQPDRFDFTVVDTLLKGARAHKVRLILLWFATWKNGSNHYMPEWMKRDAVKYPNITGKNGKPVDSPSPHSAATLEADTKAFTAVMSYLKKADPQHTVIMVQVENEPGAWGSVRDYSAEAQQLFNGPVPTELLQPGILTALHVAAGTKGNWQEVFGNNADEYFHAWSIARFIGQVAAAGKAVNPLPLYVNAALRDPLTNPSANTYESGGPTDNVLPIWKAAAPAIDLLAPDIYLNGTEKALKVLDLYTSPDNALLVPEIGFNAENAKYLYPVIAHGGIGFAPFGIDDNGRGQTDAQLTERLKPYSQEYAALTPMMRELAQWNYDGKIKAVVEAENHAEQTIDLGSWQAVITFGGGSGNANVANTQPIGKMMIVQLAADEFILVGTNCRITFKPTGTNAGRAWQYGKVLEGHYEKGKFITDRNRNGDETDFGGPRFGTVPAVLQTSLIVR